MTYGAGGSTQAVTTDLVARIRGEVGIEAMAHLTCVGHVRDELAAVIDRLRDVGIENVLLLRATPPQGSRRAAADLHADRGGFRYASELVQVRAGTARKPPLESSASAAPAIPKATPKRRAATTICGTWRQKVEAGAEFLITQLFFDNAFYFDFLQQRAQTARVRVPIVPGIMPITSFEQVDRFTRLCGATIPMRLPAAERHQHDPEAVLELGVAHATLQCIELLQRGGAGHPLLHAEQEPRDAHDLFLCPGRAAGW